MKKTAISCLLTVSMLGGVSTAAVAAPATTVQQAKANVQTQQEAYNQASQQLETAQTNLEKISNQISNLTREISQNNAQISENEAQLKVFTAEYQKDLQVEAQRIKSIYQNNNDTSVVAVMVTSKNLGQFISRMYAVNKLMQLDAQAVQKTQAAKNSMEATTQKLTQLKASNEAKLDQLNKSKAQSQALVNDLQNNKAYQAQKLAQAQATAKASIELLAKAQTVAEANNAVTALKHIAATTNSDAIKQQVNKAITDSSAKIQQIQSKPAAKPAASTNSTTNNAPAKTTVKPASTPASNTNSNNNVPENNPVPKQAPAQTVQSGNVTGQDIVSYAENFLGRPYVWGATGPNAFDCSGLTSYVYSHFGYNIGDSTYTQIDEGTPVSLNNLQAGDLIFWGDPSAPYHVAIYIGGGEYIQAPRTGYNVDISSWNLNNVSAARRIL
ncbi:MAG: NlpC/P60 family protein [Sarcina sp.]